MFIGRFKELKLLEDAYSSDKSNLVVIYGRRRIGKSCLVAKFAENKPYFYSFEALESANTSSQIEHFAAGLKKQSNDPILASTAFKTWDHVFTYLTERVIKRKSRKKLVLFLDEFPWMAVGREQLVSLVKYYWDNFWKSKNVMLILCGSVTSYMIKKVLSSKALYGRINLSILLKGLLPNEASLLFKKRSKEEILKYLLVFGPVPKYLEELDRNKSFHQNINCICFSRNSPMLNEIDRIFYSQFRETQTYLRIVNLLKQGSFLFKEIANLLGISSGGGLKHYLNNLEHAEIIQSYIPFDKEKNSKFRKYSLADEYMIFYFRYIEPNRKTIEESSCSRLFELFTNNSFEIFCGLAFERFCLKNAGHLAQIMGFSEDVLIACPYFGKNDAKFQIDMLFQRADKVITVCEIKYHNKKITTSVIAEMERKVSLLKIPRGYSLEKALISLYGPDEHVKNSGYFNHFVTLEDIFQDSSPTFS